MLSAAAVRCAGAAGVAAGWERAGGGRGWAASGGRARPSVPLRGGEFPRLLLLGAGRRCDAPEAVRGDGGGRRGKQGGEVAGSIADEAGSDCEDSAETRKWTQRISKRRVEQKWYLLAAIASTTGFTTLAAAAVISRFVWQMPASGELPYAEIFGTFAFACGAAVGMEYWARWAHKSLWHASLWNMHESHHRPRDGPFEMNDVFAIINAVPAIALMLYGFLNTGLVPGLCFGAGLGITMFGISYMFVHDGLVHRRFPVGPIADVPYLKRVAAAHQLHHADLFDGVPYGLFLGPKELEKVGGQEELEKVLQKRARAAAAVGK